MMAKLEYFIVAESLSTDRETNRVSVFNVLEEITAKLPTHFPRLTAVSAWNMAPEDRGQDFQVTLRIPQPWKETEPKHLDFHVNFTTERSRHRVYHHIEGVPLKQGGDLKLQVLLNGEPVASHSITVHDREPDRQPEAAPYEVV